MCAGRAAPDSEAGTPKAIADAALEEARRLFFVGITRVKRAEVHPGSLLITYPKEMGANTAKQLDIPFTKVNYWQAQLRPASSFRSLGKLRRRP